jgi:hypothetical protein
MYSMVYLNYNGTLQIRKAADATFAYPYAYPPTYFATFEALPPWIQEAVAVLDTTAPSVYVPGLGSCEYSYRYAAAPVYMLDYTYSPTTVEK